MRARLIASVVLFASRRHLLVLLAALVLGAGCALYAAKRLDVTTDLDGLFAASLPWKQREKAMKAMFPQFNDLLVAVVDADSPEAADATALGLEQALAGNPHVRSARRPDASPYFDREGLLFLDQPVLEKLLNQTIDAQPFLGQLATDPSARGLFAALSLLGMGVQRGEADLSAFGAPLQQFDATLKSALAGKPVPLSWERLLSGAVADLGGPYRFVLVQPKLDFGQLQPGAAATTALRDAAATLEFVRGGQAHVRVTGNVALEDEEFATVAQGAVGGLVGSSVLVIVWLAFAVRSWRLIVPIVFTLVLGLLLTTAFGTLTSNPLNLISVAFAVLFVGIAVDFAIQFAVRFRELAGAHGSDVAAALGATARRSGAQIMVASLATAAGFLAFVPTDFSGVAELGLIAGGGMLIAFGCTITVLPAAITLLRSRRPVGAVEAGFAWAGPLDAWVVRRRVPLLGAFASLALLGVAVIQDLTFDSDPLHTKNPNTEAMRTLSDLEANPLTDPYTIDVLTVGQAQALEVVAKAEKLPLVSQAISLGSLVPEDQVPKMALIADASNLLGPTLAPHAPPAPVTPADLRLAARTALGQLVPALTKLPADHPLVAVVADLRALETAPDATLLAANAALTRFLPEQLNRLRMALEAHPVTEADIPADMARDWVAPDGRWRVQISAKPGATGAAGLRRFVDQVRDVIPEAGGSAVAIVSTADTIIRAFTRAAIGAVVAILVILSVALRRVRDVLLVLTPLILSSLLTLLVAVVVSMTLNFANIIALPLLLGVGVSFNIYFVMNWRAGLGAPLQSPTARGVVFSALTTGTAFGSLALSAHPGTASMGRLLLLSLGCTLVASLVFVPALLATFRPRKLAKF